MNGTLASILSGNGSVDETPLFDGLSAVVLLPELDNSQIE